MEVYRVVVSRKQGQRQDLQRPQEGSVPDKRSRILEVVIVRRRINLGTGNLEWGGNGKGLRKGRSVHEQPETKVDRSCHSKEGFQVSKGD